ncbi:hypothetical protein KY342_01740 [Candidatus Woesearchaeota archaeon]|nr:hypothetical protein [Candidatus Woesearchaeota archaeon]
MKVKEVDSSILRDTEKFSKKISGVLKNQRFFEHFSKKHNLKLFALYTYNLSNIQKSKAVRFVYCLKGRGNEQGIVKGLNGKFLAPGCFLIPIKNDKEMQDVFKLWGIKFKRKLMLTN